jgi:hypothetical protein
MSLTECNSGTTQNLPFSVNAMIQLKIVTSTPDNTGTILSQNTPRQTPLLPDVDVIFLSSIVVLTPVDNFMIVPLLHSVWREAGLQIMKLVLMPLSSTFFLGLIFPSTPFSKTIVYFLPLMSTISNADSMDKPFE